MMMSPVLRVDMEVLVRWRRGAWLGPGQQSSHTPLPLHRGWRVFSTLMFRWCLLTDDEALAAPPGPDES